jgi:hypothetical protein
VILWLVRRMLEDKSLLYFSLAALAIGFQMVRAHIQVTYYTFIAIFIYYLFHEIAEYREKKQIKPVLLSTALLAGAVLAGVLLSAKLYVSVLDYQRFSIRGGGVGGGGLDYDYASGWSFHPLEMITFFHTGVYGIWRRHLLGQNAVHRLSALFQRHRDAVGRRRLYSSPQTHDLVHGHRRVVLTARLLRQSSAAALWTSVQALPFFDRSAFQHDSHSARHRHGRAGRVWSAGHFRISRQRSKAGSAGKRLFRFLYGFCAFVGLLLLFLFSANRFI